MSEQAGMHCATFANPGAEIAHIRQQHHRAPKHCSERHAHCSEPTAREFETSLLAFV
jgi:hypothetical protein